VNALSAVLFCMLAQSAPPLTDADGIAEMRYCDVVVRGTVESVIVAARPQDQAMPMLPGGRSDRLVEVATVRLRIESALRGDVAGETIDFVAFVGASIFRNNYEPGQETVVGLVWGADVLGGSYWLRSDYGRFVRHAEGWVAQSGSEVLSDLDGMTLALQEVAPRRLLKKAELVIMGDVRDTRMETVRGADGSTAVMLSIDLQRVEVVKGEPVGSDVTVVQLTSGDYWPSWRDSAPFRDVIARGKRYCFFLSQEADGFVVVGGVNGAFEVRGDTLYFAGRSSVDLTVKEMKRAVENEQK
jgi:hypothetical protein